MASAAKGRNTPKKKPNGYQEILIQRRRKLKEKGLPGKESTRTVMRLPDTILEGFEVLWQQCILCDVAIFTTNKTFHAHKLILVSCSDYFYDMFVDQQHQSREIHLPDIDSDIMAVLLQCMYTGKIRVTEENIEEILSTTTKLGFYLVRDACEEFLIEHTNAKNCLTMLDRSFRFGLHRLSERSLKLSAKYFPAVCRRPQFKEIPVDQMMALLKVHVFMFFCMKYKRCNTRKI